MNKSVLKSIVLGIAVAGLAVLPLNAAEQSLPTAGKSGSEMAQAGAANASRAIPFRGKLASKTESSITVGTRTFEITAETKLMKEGKPASLSEAVVGEPVGGSYLQQDDKLVAKTVRFGPKTEAEKKSKKDEDNE